MLGYFNCVVVIVSKCTYDCLNPTLASEWGHFGELYTDHLLALCAPIAKSQNNCRTFFYHRCLLTDFCICSYFTMNI